MEKLKMNIAGRVRTLLEATVEANGCRIWDVEYGKEGAEMVLRITIDREEGVTIDDCERVHRAIDPILDEADPIESSYRLEVSSPGLERALTRPEHFAASVGCHVEVRFFAPLEGRRSLTGRLVSAGEESFSVLEEGRDTPTVIPRGAAAKVHVVFDWSEL